MNLKRILSLTVVTMSLTAGASLQAAAATAVSGKDNLVCATHEVVACIDDANCRRGAAKTFDVPAFMFVDFKANELRGVDDDGSTVQSKVGSKEVTDKAVVLQGFENETGWMVAIDRADADFTLSLTGTEISFMIMGTCTTN
jgi:hypothetical protein